LIASTQPPFRADQSAASAPEGIARCREKRARNEDLEGGPAQVEDAAIRDVVKFQEGWASRASRTASSAARSSTSIPRAARRHRDPHRLHLAVPHQEGRHRLRPSRSQGHREGEAREADPARGLQVPQVGDEAHAEGDDPLADHAALPQRARRHQRDGLSRHGGLLHDVAAGLREEIRQLGEAGCTYLQLDDTNLAYLCDPKIREGARARGLDPDELPRRYAKLINAAIEGRPAGMRICTHLCRGNFKSAWVAEGGYEPVAEVLFNELDVDGYFLEYDDERSGDFRPLRFLPKGKTMVLGLVTTKLGELEPKDAIKRRIDEAAKYAPLEQLACRRSAGSRAPCTATRSRASRRPRRCG
jgi:5-methyltetrahydropteroyltriglutamate--homocysteine methyltransferase